MEKTTNSFVSHAIELAKIYFVRGFIRAPKDTRRIKDLTFFCNIYTKIVDPARVPLLAPWY